MFHIQCHLPLTGKRLDQISVTTQLLAQIHHDLRLGHTTTGKKHVKVKAQ